MSHFSRLAQERDDMLAMAPDDYEEVEDEDGDVRIVHCHPFRPKAFWDKVALANSPLIQDEP